MPAEIDDNEKFGAVAIGRNEGARLRRCLESLSAAAIVVYVDSGSTDGSPQLARDHGAEVVELEGIPFTAARARNAGFRHLRKIAPDLAYVQFVDGDCEVRPTWPARALAFLEAHSDVAVACGRRRERYPEKSTYNWLCDREWDTPVGEARACGGDAIMRVIAFDAVGGYRDQVIAGEDDELCVRLRADGWHIQRLPDEMTLHDAAMTRFGQWWRRTIRCGYAFALGANMHGAPPERHFVWESRRAWLWGVWLPLAFLMISLGFGPWGWAIWLVYLLQITRQIVRTPGSVRDRMVIALFQTLARFPESLGQIKFIWDRLRARRPSIIEYK